MKCERCNNEHDGSFGSGRFCSRFCANKREWTYDKKQRQSEILLNSQKALAANNSRRNRIIKKCVMCGLEMILRKSELHRKFCSKKCCNNDKDFKFKKKAKGGVREGGGYGKSGWYKGIQCDSSYELAWVIYSLEHGVNFIRNKKGFEYLFEGLNHKYYPDYYLHDKNEYVEIKGFKTKQHESKITQFKQKISVLYKKDLTEIFNYVINKYGKNFIELYEGNPHKLKKNKCSICGEPSKNKYCSRICSGKALCGSNHINEWDRKLNDKQVKDIKKLYNNGMTQKIIGEKFDVSQMVISQIVTGKSYKNVL